MVLLTLGIRSSYFRWLASELLFIILWVRSIDNGLGFLQLHRIKFGGPLFKHHLIVLLPAGLFTPWIQYFYPIELVFSSIAGEWTKINGISWRTLAFSRIRELQVVHFWFIYCLHLELHMILMLSLLIFHTSSHCYSTMFLMFVVMTQLDIVLSDELTSRDNFNYHILIEYSFTMFKSTHFNYLTIFQSISWNVDVLIQCLAFSSS